MMKRMMKKIMKRLYGILGTWIICILIGMVGRAEVNNFSRWHFVDSLPERSEWAVLRAQFVMPRKSGVSVMMAWNWLDSLNYNVAMAQFGAKNGDDIYGRTVEVSILKMAEGNETQICTKDVTLDDDMFTFRLVYDGFSARLYAGSNQSTFVGVAPFGEGGAMMISAPADIKCSDASSISMPIDAFSMSSFNSVEALADYLRSSTDKFEGIWEYLDRDINIDKASFGGAYRLATVSNAQDGYDILYLGGAEVNSALWHPLQTKGRIFPTIFIDNFDLEWQDADGKLLKEDNNAQFSQDGSILTLRFPLYRSQLRFSRARLKR